MRIRLMLLTSTSFIALCFFGAVAAVLAQQPVDIKITTIQMRHQQMGVGIERFAKYAKEQLGDKVRVRAYPAAQLYTGQEEIQALMKGEIQMSYIIASPLDYVDPATQVIKLPYIYPDIQTGYKIMDGPIWKKLSARLEKKKHRHAWRRFLRHGYRLEQQAPGPQSGGL